MQVNERAEQMGRFSNIMCDTSKCLSYDCWIRGVRKWICLARRSLERSIITRKVNCKSACDNHIGVFSRLSTR